MDGRKHPAPRKSGLKRRRLTAPPSQLETTVDTNNTDKDVRPDRPFLLRRRQGPAARRQVRSKTRVALRVSIPNACLSTPNAFPCISTMTSRRADRSRIPLTIPRQAVRCRAAAKEATPAKAEEFKCPLVCDALEKADAPVNEMAKAKCVHPDRAVAKACKDCPHR